MLATCSKREDVAVCCTQNEWKQVQQSCEHAKECGWATSMAQRAKKHMSEGISKLQSKSLQTTS